MTQNTHLKGQPAELRATITIVRAGTGWQTTMTDLSLILFMVTASALMQSGDGASPAAPPPASARAEPLAVWRPAAAAPPLARWLAAQPADPRQIVTVSALYGPGEQAGALALAHDLAAQAAGTGRTVRVLVEPGAGGASVTLAHDQPAAPSAPVLARPLLEPVRRPPAQLSPAQGARPAF